MPRASVCDLLGDIIAIAVVLGWMIVELVKHSH